MAKRPTNEEMIEEQKERFSIYVKESLERVTKYIEKTEKMTDEEIRQMVLDELEDLKKEFQEWNEKLIARGDKPISSLAEYGYTVSGNTSIEPKEEHDYGEIALTDETVEEVIALLVAQRDRLRAMPEEEKTRRLEAYRQKLIKNYVEAMAEDTDVVRTAHFRQMDEEEIAQAKTFKEKFINFFGLQYVSLKSAALTLTGAYGASLGILYTGGLIAAQPTFNEFMELLPILAGFGVLAYLPVTGGVISIGAIATAIVRKLTRIQQDRDIKKGLEKVRELSEQSPEWKLIYDEVINKLQEMNVDVDVAVERGL